MSCECEDVLNSNNYCRRHKNHEQSIENWTNERTKKVEDAIKRCKQYLYAIPVEKQ